MKNLRFAILLIALIISVGASAQRNIDSIIKSLETKNDVETTYSERRTAKGKPLYRVTIVLTFKNPDYVKMVENVFESERNNCVSAIKHPSSRIYKFEDKTSTSTYTFTKNPNGSYTLVKNWRDSSAEDDVSTSDITCNDPNFVAASMQYGRHDSHNHKQLNSHQLAQKKRKIMNEMHRITLKHQELVRKQQNIIRKHNARLNSLKRQGASLRKIEKECRDTDRRLADIERQHTQLKIQKDRLEAELKALQHQNHQNNHYQHNNHNHRNHPSSPTPHTHNNHLRAI